MILLEIIKKLLKIRDPNLLVGILFIYTVVEDDLDLEVEDIKRTLAIAEAFAARADVRQGKKPARLGIIEPIRDPRMRATKQIAQR